MSQYYTERKLCWCYSTITILLIISVVCTAIPFYHWRTTLDVCPGGRLENINCGCILFGVSTYQYFNGGHNSNCYFSIFAPLPLIAYGFIMSLYHLYRVCINSVGRYEDSKSTEVDQLGGELIVMTSRTRIERGNDSVIYCWIPNAIIASVFALYNLVHASIMTDGFLKTCTQYRGYLVKSIGASGNHATAIHFRLSCQSIFDFLDYLQPDTLDSRRGDFINTGLSLQLAIVSTWATVILWIVIAAYTSIRAYKEREVMMCCSK